MLPKVIDDLTVLLSKFQGVGEKTALRYVFDMLNWNDEEIENISQTILRLKTEVKKCTQCNNLSANEQCVICCDSERECQKICVVENVRDLIAIENTKSYNGKYYVLEKLISIVNGIYPEDLNIDQFVEKCKKEKIEEVILALSLSVSGETTALYLMQKLTEQEIKVTRLASGISTGLSIEYADQITLMKAFEGRK